MTLCKEALQSRMSNEFDLAILEERRAVALDKDRDFTVFTECLPAGCAG